MGEGAGYKKGYADGQDSDAYTAGYDTGYSEGYTSGYDAGFPDGVASVKTVKDLIDVRGVQSLFANVKDTTGGLSADQKIASVLSYSDTENASDFSRMFAGSDITLIPNINTSNLSSADSICSSCTKIVNVEFDFKKSDLSSVFYNCILLQNVSVSIDGSVEHSLSSTFNNCRKLHNVSLNTTLKVKTGSTMYRTFYNAMLEAEDNETFPYIDTSGVSIFDDTFAVDAGVNQRALNTIPAYDLSGSNYAGIRDMFNNRLIREIPDLKLPELSVADWNDIFKSKNNFYYFFKGNTVLSKLHFTDIYGSLDISVSTQFTREALLEIIGNLRDITGFTSQTLTLGATNLAKLTEEDIALATEKNWTVA